VYLPTYSPELNPVELVFNKMKAEIRKTETTQNIETRILLGLSQISQDDMIQFYQHCINRDQLDLYLNLFEWKLEHFYLDYTTKCLPSYNMIPIRKSQITI